MVSLRAYATIGVLARSTARTPSPAYQPPIAGGIVLIGERFDRDRCLDVGNGLQAVGIVVAVARDHTVRIRKAGAPSRIVVGKGHSLRALRHGLEPGGLVIRVRHI